MKLHLLLITTGIALTLSAMLVGMSIREWQHGQQWVAVTHPSFRLTKGVRFWVSWPNGFDGTEMLARMLKGGAQEHVYFPEGTTLYVRRYEMGKVEPMPTFTINPN